MDFWTRSHPLETNSADAALVVSLSVAEFDRWRGAIMRGKFAPRGSRVAPFGFSRDIRCTYVRYHGIYSPGLMIATKDRRDERKRESCYLFFFPSISLTPHAESVGLFIFDVSKRVTDDATMLIPPCGN